MFWDPVFLLQNEKNETFYIKKSGLRGKKLYVHKTKVDFIPRGTLPQSFVCEALQLHLCIFCVRTIPTQSDASRGISAILPNLSPK